VEITCRVYKPRRPRESPPYRLVASYHNWPAVALAALTAIVPDFPLVNKSFELCYSCTDR